MLSRRRVLLWACVVVLRPLPIAAQATATAAIEDSARISHAIDLSQLVPGASVIDRARALDRAISELLVGSHPSPKGLALAEQFATELDALPDTADGAKLTGHASLLAYYGYADIDAPLRHHAQAMLVLGRRVRNVAAIAQAYEALARTAGDYLDADSALLLLDQGERELSALGAGGAAKGQQFAELRSLYTLVGTHGTPIHGDHWLNAPDTLRELPVGGKVLLIQFTAHWCIPCRNSYPGMNQLAAHFAGRAFEAVFSTDLYGYFGSTTNRLSPADEIAADRKYYLTDHQIPFKIAINNGRPPALRAKPGAPPLAVVAETDAQRYAVGGIPQMFVIDKHGIIRATITGWDPGAEDRLTKLIEQLLREGSS